MLSLLAMGALLGVSSFGCGMLPLSFVFSSSGLLLGTALGVIIPEGIEALADVHPASEIPVSRIALSLLCGFTFMLVIEQIFSPHSHSHNTYDNLTMNHVKPSQPSGVEFDAELGELELEQGMPRASSPQAASRNAQPVVQEELLATARKQAIPLTVGLVIHSLADGLALGVSFFPAAGGATSNLSAIVFLAIIIHKLPTSLALTTSLLSTSLPRQECKKHLAAFSASTPVAAVLTYAVLEFFGGGDNADWIGLSLLLSGGTFLNVATMVSSHNSASQSNSDLSNRAHLALTIVGIFIPFALSSLLGHGH